MTATDMTPTDLDLARSEVISSIVALQTGYAEFVATLRPFHPLGPPSEIRDKLYEGLSKEEEGLLRDEVRAYAAAAIVAALWIGLAKGSGDVAGANQAFAREEVKDLQSQHGSKGETMVEQLKRFATIAERAEARHRRANSVRD